MTQAVIARRGGDAFQARWFWLKAAGLLDHESPVSRVGFEIGPKGFDDIWVEYDSRSAPLDSYGEPLLREHVQSKWHVTPSSFGFAELAEPDFINASARSLLERARAAQREHAASGVGVRFRFLTNWQIDRRDPLARLVDNRSHSLRLDVLFGTATDQSAMGRVRQLWREHLQVDDDELRRFARVLAVSVTTDSLEALRERLDERFRVVGLRRIPPNEMAFPYDDLVFQWLAQGQRMFDRDTLRAACERQKLLVGGEQRPRVFGVKSFEHPVDRLEERCTAVLDLVPVFNDRYIQADAEWTSTVYPRLKSFLLDAAKGAESIRLSLDAHLTISFAAGSVLNIKCGRRIELEQRTIARAVWAVDDVGLDRDWPTLVVDGEVVNDDCPDVAVAVGLTHDISAAVRDYVTSALPHVGLLLHAKPSGGPGARSVAAGGHAFELAESLTASVRATKVGSRRAGAIHLFMSCPGGFAFFLGQRQQALGPITLYEFDFEGARGGSYAPSLSLR